MQQPRQSRQGLPRGSGRTSSARSSTVSLGVDEEDVNVATGDQTGDVAISPKAKTLAAATPLLTPKPLLPKAPSRWKAPVGKLMAAKAFAGSALPDDRAAVEVQKKTQKDTSLRWYVGLIYCGFGIFDITSRVVGVILWKIRFNTTGTPRLSDTQRFEVIGNVVNTWDLWRLVIVGAAAVIRCIVNLVVLWPAFGHLRPSWMTRGRSSNASRLMRYICPVFRGLLALWCLADFLQACTPDIPPDPTEHQILTAHIFFHQIAWICCGLVNLILFVTLFHDRDAGDVFVAAGLFSWTITLCSFIYYDVTLFRGEPGKSTPMGWALAVETSALMFNAGLALPSSIIAIPGTLERKSWMVHFMRLGKVRAGEDTSARTGDKPLLVQKIDNRPVCKTCGKICAMDSVFCRNCGNKIDAESEGSDEDKAKKTESSSSPEDEIIKKQRAELADLNAKIKVGKYGRGRKAAKDSKHTGSVPEAPPAEDDEAPVQLVAGHDPYAP